MLFDWETAGNTDGWALDWGGATGVSQSTAFARSGRGALAVQFALQGSGWRDLGVTRYYSTTQNLSSGTNTLTGWVYLPAGAPSNLVAQLGLFNGSYVFQTSPEFTAVPGSWVQITWPNAPLQAVRGISVLLGGSNPNYTGTLYVDGIARAP
jgi:hypothetical protein